MFWKHNNVLKIINIFRGNLVICRLTIIVTAMIIDLLPYSSGPCPGQFARIFFGEHRIKYIIWKHFENCKKQTHRLSRWMELLTLSFPAVLPFSAPLVSLYLKGVSDSMNANAFIVEYSFHPQFWGLKTSEVFCCSVWAMVWISLYTERARGLCCLLFASLHPLHLRHMEDPVLNDWVPSVLILSSKIFHCCSTPPPSPVSLAQW